MRVLDNSELTRVSGGRPLDDFFGGLIAIGSAMAIVGMPEVTLPALLRIPRDREQGFHGMVNTIPRQREQRSTGL